MSPLPEDLLSQFSDFVSARTALHFPRPRWPDLERMARSASKEFGATEPGEFIEWLMSSHLTQEQIELLASHLTVSETYFWREAGTFEALMDKILPELVHRRERSDRRLRIWSAGCATGEEPYSIAMALRRVIPAVDDWNVTLLATDINSRMLRKAAAGVYGRWSFRNAPPWLKDGCFRRTKDGKREILSEIRKMVSFAYLNLAEDAYPSPMNNTAAMDVIFCRNVLMYFAPERVRQIGKSLHHCLVEGGWLMIGSSELSPMLFPQFEAVHFSGAIVYRKGPENPRPTTAFPNETALAQEPFVPTLLKPVDEAERFEPPDELSANDGIPSFERSALQHTPCEKSETLKEKSPNAVSFSVRALANRGRLAEALTSCDEAIAADKLDIGLHYLRATILQEMNHKVEAIASLKRALYLDPDFMPAHFVLGNLAMSQGDVRTARRCFQNVLTLLDACEEEDILTESEGLTAGRFKEIVHSTMRIGALA